MIKFSLIFNIIIIFIIIIIITGIIIKMKKCLSINHLFNLLSVQSESVQLHLFVCLSSTTSFFPIHLAQTREQ